MDAASPRRTGLFVVRLWTEEGLGRLLRARITRSLDVTTREEQVTHVSSVEEIREALNLWLRDFTAAS